MADSSTYHQEETERRRMAVDIALLQQQMTMLSDVVHELRKINEAQTAKLDAVLIKMAEARGGMATLMKFGGAATVLGAALAWALDHVFRWLLK